MNKPYDIIVFGDTCVDLILQDEDITPRFGQVEKLVASYNMVMGGSCCIFAAQAAKLGLKVVILGRVGDDAFGHLLLETLNTSGVDTQHMIVDANLKTGLTVHLTQRDDRAMLTYLGSLNSLEPHHITDELLNSAKHLHYGSLYLHTGLLPKWVDILKRAKAFGLTISLDTNWDPDEKWDVGLTEAYPYIDILLPNEQEAQYLSAQNTLSDAIDSLRSHIPILAIKKGVDGAVAYYENQQSSQTVIPAEIGGDGIGAGDSFDAGFVTGWLSGLSIEECLSVASQCGRSVAGQVGGVAGQPLRRQITALN